MKKKYDNTQNAKHSKLTEKQILKNNIKYILLAIALIIAIIMLLFAESKLIITNRPAGEDVQVKFNKLYYLNEETEERFLTLSDAIAKAVQDDPTEKSTIKVINNKTETSVVTIPAGKEIELDLNGKIVAFNIDPESADESGITNYGDLTITDSTDVLDATNVVDYTMADGSKPHVAGTITSNKRVVTNKVTVTNNEITGRGNLVISGTAHINGTGDSNYTIVNDGTMTVNGGTITSDVSGTICNGENAVSANTTVNGGTIISQKMGIYNIGNNNQENNPAVLITGGKIEAQSNAINNFDTSTGLIYIVGGDIKGGLNNANNPTIYNGGNGKIIIDEEHAGDTVITDYSSNCAIYNGYVSAATGIIEIKGGTIIARNEVGIKNNRSGTLIIGTDEVAAGETTFVNTTVPSIKGATAGIVNSNNINTTFNFYDGQITGPTNESLNRGPNAVPQYFAKVVIDNGDGTETAILKRSIEYAQAKDIEIYDIDKTQIELTTTEDMESVASYTSNDTGVVTVNSTGEVTGVAEGTTTITITGQSGRTKTVNVKVKPTYNSSKSVNAPKLTNGMIPIKWNGSTWVVCSEDDSDWYTYGNTAATQNWANVMLSDGTYKAGTVEVNQEVAESDLGSMYTWIPRYSYKMPENAQTTKGTIDITYLKKNTNEGSDGVVYQKAASNTDTETTKVVHPAFTLGTKELSGFWVAKFEMSGKDSNGDAVGNESASSAIPVEYEEGVTIAKSLPNVPSWRHITIGESQYQSMLIAGDNKASYGIDSGLKTTSESSSSHLIKNSEWGAVAYLCYSNYGSVPEINGCGSNNSWCYDLYTGQGPKASGNTSRYAFDSSTIASHGYSTANGMLASTTGNITGVYDMNGGSWEYIAVYLDNGNGYLNTYGKSSSNSSVTYFNSGVLSSAYTDLWDAYEVSSEEKNNVISINSGASTVTQSELWQDARTEETYIEARKRLTDAIYSNMAKYKGIGVNEVSTECSFYTTFAYKNGSDTTVTTWGWFNSVATALSRASGTSRAGETVRTWDDDFVKYGHVSRPFVCRGGDCTVATGAGVLYSNGVNGGAGNSGSFRSVIIADDGYEAPAKSNKTTLRMASENLLYGLDDCGETVGSNNRLKYSISNKVITAINTGIHIDGYVATSGRVYLEAGRNYRFECNTNGSPWRTDGGTDIGSVGVSLISNSNSSDFAVMESDNCSFTAPATGSYYLRISVYGKNQTATFSNMTVTYADDNNLQNNTAYGTLPTPTILGYTFGGWYANAMKTTTLIDNYKVDGTTGNITADNDYITSGLINVQGGTVLYTNMIISGIYSYDINGNLIGKSSDKTSTHLLPAKAKYIRVEIAKSGGNTVSYYNDNLILSDYQDASGVAYINSEVTSATVNAIGKEHTLFAKMVASEYDVTFDKNDGSGTTTTVAKACNSKLGTLTNPTRTGYIFTGWYTDADGGMQINENTTVPPSDVTYYAHWDPDLSNTTIKDIEIYDIDTAQIDLSNKSTYENITSYVSADTSIATVSNTGLVTAVSAGTTTITMTGSSGATKTINVTVKPSYNSTKSVNAPKLTNGMIPIKWNGTTWVVCSENDSDWYTYGNTAATQQWANVMLSDGTYKASTVAVGQTVAESDLGSMYVWIPRYSYQMPANATTTKGTIDVTFLKKNTNVGVDGNTYIKPADNTNTETTKVVHPAFTLGNNELSGFWMAKFEMSGKRSDTTVTNGVVSNAVGNATASGNNGDYDPAAYEAGVTIAKSLPNFPSWRNITIGESEYQSMLIASDNKDKYGIDGVSSLKTTADSASSHLIKNSEWGAVAYLCYSNYGTVPQINGCGSYVTNNSSWYYDIYTGQGPDSSGSTSGYDFDPSSTIADRGYSTTKGMLASTTGNITGVYDMNGGSWERVAAYLDNGNGNLNSCGKSTSNSSVTYFNGGALLSAYTDLWDAYEVSSEEKTNEISINGGASTVTQSQLWQNAKTEETYIEARKRLTDATYSNMAKHKGIGVNEVSTECSFYTTFDYKSKIAGTDPVEYETKNTWNWFKSVATAISRANGTSTAAEYATSWDGDFVLIGHASDPFVMRGGLCSYGAGAGVFFTNISHGYANTYLGFRAVLVP